LPLFRPTGTRTQGASFLEDLQGAQVGLAALDASAHGLPASAKLRALQDLEYASAAALAHSATKPVSGLGRLGRWTARRKLRKLLATLGLSRDDAAISDFVAAVRLESALRPFRARIESVSSILFGKVADRGVPPSLLTTLAKEIYKVLARVQHLVKAI